jgi:hypothetical protein
LAASRRMAASARGASFETPRKRAAPQDEWSFTPRAAKTHNTARRNMIAGGAAYSYWALKSPVLYVRANWKKVQPSLAAPEPFPGGSIELYLIDSQLFTASARTRAGAVLFGTRLGAGNWICRNGPPGRPKAPAKTTTSAVATRSEARPSPARI